MIPLLAISRKSAHRDLRWLAIPKDHDLETGPVTRVIVLVQGAVTLSDTVVEAARVRAQAAVDLAIAEGGDGDAILEAQEFIAQGDILRDAREAQDAVSKYNDALAKAESA